MVVFTCNHCGDSLQKPKVEKHYSTTCRKAKFVTCVDCFKDFRDEEYVSHIKCISEEQRYAAKGTLQNVVKKGEVKQESWMDMINSILTTDQTLKPHQKELLQFIAGNNNVPRKKQKFINFVCSSSSRKASQKDIEAIWDIIEKHKNAVKEKATESSQTNGNSLENQTPKKTKEENDEIGDKVFTPNLFDSKEGGEKKKKKKTGKSNNIEEPNQKKAKTETPVDEQPPNKKSKKLKNGTENICNQQQETVTEETPKKLKKKRKMQNGDTHVTSNSIPEKKIKKEPTANEDNPIFSFQDAILNILKSKKSISTEKLEKKVLNAYIKHENLPEVTNQIKKKYKKKLNKMSNLQVNETTVMLLQES